MSDPVESVELVLTKGSYAEVVGNLLALRALATELESVFTTYEPRAGRSAAAGAHVMVETVDRILDELRYSGEREVGGA